MPSSSCFASAPDDLRGLLLAGAVDYQLGSFATAEAELVKVLQTVPGHMCARRLLVATYLRLDQPAKALDTLKPVLGYVEKDPAFLALAGEVYLRNGQPAEAAKYFTKSVALDPKSSGGRLGLAVEPSRQGRDGSGIPGTRKRGRREFGDASGSGPDQVGAGPARVRQSACGHRRAGKEAAEYAASRAT